MLPQNNSLLITDVIITCNVSEDEFKQGWIWKCFTRTAIFATSAWNGSSEIRRKKKNNSSTIGVNS